MQGLEAIAWLQQHQSRSLRRVLDGMRIAMYTGIQVRCYGFGRTISHEMTSSQAVHALCSGDWYPI